MGDAFNCLFSLYVGSFLSHAVLRLLVTQADGVRRAWALRRRGRTATATTVSVAEVDIEGSLEAVVRFEVEPGREVKGTVQLPLKPQLNLVKGAEVQIRYDPATPKIIALEAGRRQGHTEIRLAVITFTLIPVMVLPTSIYLVYAGLRTLLHNLLP